MFFWMDLRKKWIQFGIFRMGSSPIRRRHLYHSHWSIRWLSMHGTIYSNFVCWNSQLCFQFSKRKNCPVLQQSVHYNVFNVVFSLFPSYVLHSAFILQSVVSCSTCFNLDTLVRLAVTTEFEYGVKQVLALLSSTLASVNKNTNLGPAQQDRSRDLLFVLCDILSYRFINYPFPVGSKVQFFSFSCICWV